MGWFQTLCTAHTTRCFCYQLGKNKQPLVMQLNQLHCYIGCTIPVEFSSSTTSSSRCYLTLQCTFLLTDKWSTELLMTQKKDALHLAGTEQIWYWCRPVPGDKLIVWRGAPWCVSLQLALQRHLLTSIVHAWSHRLLHLQSQSLRSDTNMTSRQASSCQATFMSTHMHSVHGANIVCHQS